MITTNEPSLPSYESPIYKGAINDWRFVQDMYKGRKAWLDSNGLIITEKAQVYLPIEADEKEIPYNNRIRRSLFQRRFGNSIDAFAGMMSRFSLTGKLPKSFEDYVDNVDRAKNSFSKFLIQADIAALRDGICYILVDFPIKPDLGRVMTHLDEIEMGLRPYLTLYEAKQVVNLQVDENMNIEMVSIREAEWEKNNRFGSELVERYRVLFPGGGELWRVQEQSGKSVLIMEKEWISTNKSVTLVPYSISVGAQGIFGVVPPLLDFAMLNLKHYQKESEKDELMHKCNVPILQINRKGGVPSTANTGTRNTNAKQKPEEPTVTIGPNTVLFNVEAAYIEPTGAALSLTIADLRDLEEAMTQKTLDFLTLSDVSKTATEVIQSAAPLAASLGGMIVGKENAVQTIFDYWDEYSGGNGHNATIEIDEGAIRSTINTANVDRLRGMRSDRSISLKTYLTLAQEAKVLPASLDLDKEIEEVTKEAEVEMEKAKPRRQE